MGLDGCVLVVFIRGCALTRDIIGKNTAQLCVNAST